MPSKTEAQSDHTHQHTAHQPHTPHQRLRHRMGPEPLMCKRCGAPLNTGKVYCSRRCALYAKRAAQRSAPKPKAKPKPKTPANRAGVVSAEYLRNRTTLKARAQAAGLPCWVCGQPIDWNAEPRTRWSFSADHRQPRSKGGTSALSNLVQAHYGCNSRRGDGTRRPKMIEQTSETSRW